MTRIRNNLRKLLSKYDRKIQVAFIEAIQRKSSSINVRELERAIEARDLNRVITIAGITRADLFPVDQAINAAYIEAGQTIPAAAPAFAASFGFDGRATRAVAWAQMHVGGLVTSIVDDQLDLLRETIAGQVNAGVNPRQVALDIAGRTVNGKRQGGFIGLSGPQKQYLDNARNELANLDSGYFRRTLRDRRYDSLVRKAIKDGKPLAKADIDKIAGRYSDRMLKHRADVIARTESITALRAGRREGIQQGIEAGAIKAENLERVWRSTDATYGRRTRNDHVDMNGQRVSGMDAPFVAPDGSRLLYPGDSSLGASASQTVQCRCYDEYDINWLKG